MEKLETQFYVRFYDSPAGKIALLTMDNGADYKKPNTFSEKSLKSLNSVLDDLEKDKDIKGLMLTGKPYIFAAGADLTAIPFITTYEQGYMVGKMGHDTMKRIMELPYPTLAAINGLALGGGLEIALYCKYRTISRAVPAIAFPECFLGLVPGWGGCTLTTKLIGPEKALQIIIYNALNQNRMIKGPQAFELGLADRMFDNAEFLDDSLRLLIDIISGKTRIKRKKPDFKQVDRLIKEAKEFVDSKVHGAAIAPYRALDLIKGACSWDIDTGFEEENKALGDLVKSRQCKASIYAFDLVNRHARNPRGVPDVKPLKVNKVGIIGAGLMASQLAYLFLYRLKVPVVVKDIKQEIIDNAKNYIENELKKAISKGKLEETKFNYMSSLFKGTLEWKDFEDCDFVIEAVFEDMDVKKQVFKEAEEVTREDTILASNTSSLSITEMGSELKHPERVIGFHFFNPVAVLPLVEIIRSKKTNDLTLATAFDVAKKIRKTGLLVKDSPAFLVNRILTKMMVDCLEIVDNGATFQQVDDALLSLGLPIAPFDLLALVGPPVAFHVLETLNRSFGPERFPLNENFKKVIELGKKSIYLPDKEKKVVDPEIEKIWEKKGDHDYRKEEILDIVLENLTREIDLILREKVVASSRDVDMAMILGAGWPFFMGGITMYLDLAGITPRVLQKVFFSF